jgi:hypothetical protein
MLGYIQAHIVGIVYGTANEEGDVLNQPALLRKAYQLGMELGTDA